MGLGPNFSKDAQSLSKSFTEGVISIVEYRRGLRAAGLSLDDDAEVFPDLAPLDDVPDNLGEFEEETA